MSAAMHILRLAYQHLNIIMVEKKDRYTVFTLSRFTRTVYVIRGYDLKNSIVTINFHINSQLKLLKSFFLVFYL